MDRKGKLCPRQSKYKGGNKSVVSPSEIRQSIVGSLFSLPLKAFKNVKTKTFVHAKCLPNTSHGLLLKRSAIINNTEKDPF